MKKQEIKLSEILPEFEKEVNKLVEYRRGVTNNSRRSNKRAYNALLKENYTEVILVSKRILTGLKEIDIVSKQIFDPDIINKTKTFTPEERQILGSQHTSILSYLQLDIKILYLLTALIFDIFRKSKAKIDLKELERISLFRNQLITHIHTTPLFNTAISTKHGTLYHPEKEKFEVMYTSPVDTDSKFKGLNKLVKKATVFIPDLANEINHYERIKIIYRQLDKISDRRLRKDITDFFFKVGLTTENPAVIAQALFQALKSHRRNRYSISK